MSAEKEFTYSDVAEHNVKKNIYVVVHDKVYDATSFVDEHPGGEEVLMDVGGQDATEAFEDVGHSDEAREVLDGLLVGKLKRQSGDPAPKVPQPSSLTAPAIGSSGAGLGGLGLYAVILVGGVLAFGAYKYLQAKQDT